MLDEKKKPRQTQKQRSSYTTNAIMQASIDLIFDNGFSGMTIAQVAQRSGASQGAITHHYRNKESLVIAAAKYTVDRERIRLHTDLPKPQSRIEAIDLYIDASEQFFLNKYFVTLLEIFLAARRNPNISAAFDPLISDHRRLFDCTWSAILQDAGLQEFEAQQLIDMTNFMLRGVSLALTRQEDETLSQELQNKCALFREKLHLLFDN